MAVSLPGVYSRLSDRTGLPPSALHLVIWLSVAAVSSIALFMNVYRQVFVLIFDTEAQQSAGAYPLAMLLFLILWLGINSDSIRERLRQDVDGFNSLPTGLGVSLALFSVLLSLNMSLFDATWGVFLQIVVLLVWFEGLALIFANATGLFALRYLALFVPTASIQYIFSTFFDGQISSAFLSIFFPYLLLLGYPVTLNAANPLYQLVYVNRPDGAVTLWINAGCTGLPAISVFLLLAGLIYLDAKPKKKIFIPSLIGGLALILFLNMIRLTILVDQALAAPSQYAGYIAVAEVHSWIGYAIYSIFYVAYVFVMLRPSFRRE